MRLSLITLICISLMNLERCPAEVQDAASDSSKLREAVSDLIETFGNHYPHGNDYLDRLHRIEDRLGRGEAHAKHQLKALRREALLANPLLTKLPGILAVKRKIKNMEKDNVFTTIDTQIGYSAGPGRDIGMPSNHECNASLERDGYDNEICLLLLVAGKVKLKTIYRPEDGGYVGELDLHFDGKRVLFTKSDAVNWKLYKMNISARHLFEIWDLEKHNLELY